MVHVYHLQLKQTLHPVPLLLAATCTATSLQSIHHLNCPTTHQQQCNKKFTNACLIGVGMASDILTSSSHDHLHQFDCWMIYYNTYIQNQPKPIIKLSLQSRMWYSNELFSQHVCKCYY